MLYLEKETHNQAFTGLVKVLTRLAETSHPT